MVAIDIFSGAGGMSLGAILAGFEVEIAVENNKCAAATYKANHPETDVICKDIQDIAFAPRNEPPFVLCGGPPCQGFSISNTKTRNSENRNNSLFHEFIRVTNELQPLWFVFENVEGITTFERGTVVERLKKEFEKINYQVKEDVLIASDYGVPQTRNRFFMVGNRMGLDFTFPPQNKRKVTVSQAINDLPTLVNGDNIQELPYKKIKPSRYAKLLRGECRNAKQNFVSRNQNYVIERYKHIGQGENWKSIPAILMKNYKNLDNCHSGIYRRLNSNIPSVVIANYRKNMLIHPLEDRGLSVREAARLQSFPDDFVFKGSLTDIQQQIGNAVPPLLAKAIFSQIINIVNQHGQAGGCQVY